MGAGFPLTRAKLVCRRDFDHQGVWLKSGCSNLRRRLALASPLTGPGYACCCCCCCTCVDKCTVHTCIVSSSREPCSMYMYIGVCLVQQQCIQRVVRICHLCEARLLAFVGLAYIQ